MNDAKITTNEEIKPEEELKHCKNLANCTNVEFLVQTNKIRKQAASWIKATDIFNIRKKLPAGMIQITESMTEEEKKAATANNDKLVEAQWKQNISDMLDAALEKNAEKTVELLGMMCFLTPEETAEAKPFFLIRNFWEMFSDKDVMAFFISLMRSELIPTLMNAKV